MRDCPTCWNTGYYHGHGAPCPAGCKPPTRDHGLRKEWKKKSKREDRTLAPPATPDSGLPPADSFFQPAAGGVWEAINPGDIGEGRSGSLYSGIIAEVSNVHQGRVEVILSPQRDGFPCFFEIERFKDLFEPNPHWRPSPSSQGQLTTLTLTGLPAGAAVDVKDDDGIYFESRNLPEGLVYRVPRGDRVTVVVQRAGYVGLRFQIYLNDETTVPIVMQKDRVIELTEDGLDLKGLPPDEVFAQFKEMYGPRRTVDLSNKMTHVTTGQSCEGWKT